MKIALYGRITRSADFDSFKAFLLFCRERNIDYRIYDAYADGLIQSPVFADCPELLEPRFLTDDEIKGCDFLYSIGGDGTILDAVRFASRSCLPILGVNSGRLGFLASVSQFDLVQVTQDLQNNRWREEQRAMIEVVTQPEDVFGESNFGLNEITIHKSNSNEMIVVHTYINGEFLNSYWADGLIISTPTGSSAYSLACGGPIIVPQSQTFVITPIAPHSLTVRPVIIPDASALSFEVESRSGQALVAIDNRTALVQDHLLIGVKKHAQPARMVKVNSQSYFNTLRQRLSWGVDTRKY